MMTDIAWVVSDIASPMSLLFVVLILEAVGDCLEQTCRGNPIVASHPALVIVCEPTVDIFI